MKKFLILSTLLLVVLILPGCIKIKSSSDSGPTAESLGGIYKSVTQGDSWASSSRIASVSDDRPSFGGFNVTSVVIDPQDQQAMYVGTENHGLFLSYDGGESWQQFKTLAEGRIESIAVHPQNKCMIFVSMRNTILRSEDCSRTWQRVYFDSRVNTRVTTLAIDWFDPTILYAGTSEGEVLKSIDTGQSWATVLRADNNIKDIIIGADTRHAFVGTEYNGIFVTKDKGATWTHRYDEIQEKGSVEDLTDMTLDFRNNVLIIATKHGLMRTADMGATWESVPLVAPEDSSTIYTVAVNPADNNEIYYGTAVAFFKSLDGGKNWISSQLPTPSIPRVLVVHPGEHNKLYLGFQRIEK